MRKLILRMLLTLVEVAAGENGQIANVDYGDEGSWSDTFETLKTGDAMLIGATAHWEYLDYWKSVLSDPKAKPPVATRSFFMPSFQCWFWVRPPHASAGVRRRL